MTKDNRRWAAVLFAAISVALGAGAYAPRAACQTYTVIYAFKGAPDASSPLAGLVPDSSGNLYGTTIYGGDSSCNPPIGCGAVFKVNLGGTEDVLHSFTGGSDGANPYGILIRDSSGNLYGSTPSGGSYNAGLVFKLSSTGSPTPLYTFTGGADGGQPSNLVLDASGNLYGTAASGGKNGYGVVFELSPTGQETVLYDFAGGMDGEYPSTGVIRDSLGNLYGTTPYGGVSNNCLNGYTCGVVFEIAASGQERVLYRFKGGLDGASPFAGLIRDKSGNLYGTTFYGGESRTCGGQYGCGTVFEISGTGRETVLYRFTGGADGSNPYTALVGDIAGNLYGTTLYGGSGHRLYGSGLVFELAPDGQESVLYTFTGGKDGGNPSGTLFRLGSSIYGTTYTGGDMSGCEFGNGCGVVFKLAL